MVFFSYNFVASFFENAHVLRSTLRYSKSLLLVLEKNPHF
jgi:hypothetical protein